mgnify:CR=1 FL=1
MVAGGVDRMKTSAEPVPLILVGGGAVLINRDIPGTTEVIVPGHAGVANAIGASIAQIAKRPWPRPGPKPASAPWPPVRDRTVSWSLTSRSCRWRMCRAMPSG